MIPFHCRSANVCLRGRRSSNQDVTADMRFPDGRHLVVVADGMGGHRSGEVAAAIAVEVLCREVGAGSGLRAALAAANAAVFAEAECDPGRSGMGTTLVALLRYGAVYEIANVGDSRAYRVEQQSIRQITRDHSFAAEAARSSLMSPDQIARSPWRNALTRSIGTQGSVEIDVFGPFEIAGPPHVVLLCSDGMYRALPDASIRGHLLAAGDVDAAARTLSALALEHGSDDNISVAVVEFGAVLAASETAEPRPGAARPIALPAPLQSAIPDSRSVGPASLAALVRPGPWATAHWLRRILATATSDNALFMLFVSITLIWLILHLSAQG